MIIDGKQLSQQIISKLKKDIDTGINSGWKRPRLVIFTVQPTYEVESFIKSKQFMADKIGAEVKVISYKKAPRFEDFANKVAVVAQKTTTHGIIIQLPLPAALSTMTILDYIPTEKEIEGFKKKSPFEHPVGLAVLTLLKKVYASTDDDSAESIMISKKDIQLFKTVFKRKKVVLLGRGPTGGQPIGNTLTKHKVNYINLNSKTTTSDMFMEQADVIISAVGKDVVDPELVKDGAVLISVGTRKEGKKWHGDFDEKAIEQKALAYSPTPGGVGPLNVAYLFSNLIQAWTIQNEAPPVIDEKTGREKNIAKRSANKKND